MIKKELLNLIKRTEKNNEIQWSDDDVYWFETIPNEVAGERYTIETLADGFLLFESEVPFPRPNFYTFSNKYQKEIIQLKDLATENARKNKKSFLT